MRPKVVFSDLDGTLVHFASQVCEAGAEITVLEDCAVFEHQGQRRSGRILPTSTMGPGMMSDRTVQLINEIRSHGVHFVYVTGARCSTLMERLPIMATADAAFAETGGRFMRNRCEEIDEEWTSRMEAVCGPVPRDVQQQEHQVPLAERTGALWTWARLLEEKGYKLDTRSYFFCFRVDLQKQTDGLSDPETFQKFILSNLPSTLSAACNLGKFDFFPSISGKGNAVRYYMDLHGFSSEEAISLFDDDNDLPMADHTGTCYVLQSTHPSVNAAISRNPSWIVCRQVGVLAAEEALESILSTLCSP